MRIRMPRLSIVLVLQAFFLAPASDAMDMPHYDLISLVYMSTDIVIADLSEEAEHKFTATVTETLYGSLSPMTVWTRSLLFSFISSLWNIT